MLTVTQSVTAFALLLAAHLPDVGWFRPLSSIGEARCESKGHRHALVRKTHSPEREAIVRPGERADIQILSFGP